MGVYTFFDNGIDMSDPVLWLILIVISAIAAFITAKIISDYKNL